MFCRSNSSYWGPKELRISISDLPSPCRKVKQRKSYQNHRKQISISSITSIRVNCYQVIKCWWNVIETSSTMINMLLVLHVHACLCESRLCSWTWQTEDAWRMSFQVSRWLTNGFLQWNSAFLESFFVTSFLQLRSEHLHKWRQATAKLSPGRCLKWTSGML